MLPDHRDGVLQELLVVERRPAEVQRAEVDAVAMRGLLVQPFERAAQHPSVDLRHQAVALGGRDEARRRKHVAVAVAHADQHLVAQPGGCIAQRHDGLQLREEVLHRQAFLHAGHQLDLVQVVQQLRAARVIADDSTSAHALGFRAGPVARAQGIGRPHAVEHADHADARRHAERLVLVLVCTLAQIDAQPLAKRLGGLERDSLQDHHELVAAHARGDVRRHDHRAHPRRELAQDLVAGGVPEEVVDELEAVEVDIGEAERPLAGDPGRLAQADLEPAPVQQAGQRVVVDEELELFLGLLSQRDLLDPRLVAIGLAHRAKMEPAPPPVLMIDGHLRVHHSLAGRQLLQRPQRLGIAQIGPVHADPRSVHALGPEHDAEGGIVLDHRAVELHREDPHRRRVVVLPEAMKGGDGAVLGSNSC